MYKRQIIASGGAGALEHFYDVLTEGGADAVLAASVFHYKEFTVKQVKTYLQDVYKRQAFGGNDPGTFRFYASAP